MAPASANFLVGVRGIRSCACELTFASYRKSGNSSKVAEHVSKKIADLHNDKAKNGRSAAATPV